MAFNSSYYIGSYDERFFLFDVGSHGDQHFFLLKIPPIKEYAEKNWWRYSLIQKKYSTNFTEYGLFYLAFNHIVSCAILKIIVFWYSAIPLMVYISMSNVHHRVGHIFFIKKWLLSILN